MIYILGKGGHAGQVKASLYPNHPQMIGLEDTMHLTPLDQVICGVGDLHTRLDMWNEFKENDWATVIDENALVAKIADQGGIYIGPNSYVGEMCLIGANVLINYSVSIGHDCRIDDHAIISPGVTLCGGVILGERCQIGAGATILQGVHLDDGTNIPAGSLVVKPDDIRKPVRVVQDDGVPKITLGAGRPEHYLGSR
jgi:carbonic anhydrase/acetyltransferase-like protein (isoleucine patch superfamily)